MTKKRMKSAITTCYSSTNPFSLVCNALEDSTVSPRSVNTPRWSYTAVTSQGAQDDRTGQSWGGCLAVACQGPSFGLGGPGQALRRSAGPCSPSAQIHSLHRRPVLLHGLVLRSKRRGAPYLPGHGR